MLLGKQTVSVYKPIQDEAGVAAAIALALRSGDDIKDAAESYESPLASGGSDGVDHRHRLPKTASPPTPPRATASCPTWRSCPIGVTVDNVADTVIADEFRTVEELCTGDVASTEFCQQNS